MFKHITLLAAAFLSVVAVLNADATPSHQRQHQNRTADNVVNCNERGCSDRKLAVRTVTDANGSFAASRPAGCPHAYCGCEASLYLFGHIRPELNLASNWMRKFPRTAPAAGMVAVRNHHVMVLVNQVDGTDWLVHEGNADGGLTRDHVRSIRGYIIVNPRGA